MAPEDVARSSIGEFAEATMKEASQAAESAPGTSQQGSWTFAETIAGAQRSLDVLASVDENPASTVLERLADREQPVKEVIESTRALLLFIKNNNHQENMIDNQTRIRVQRLLNKVPGLVAQLKQATRQSKAALHERNQIAEEVRQLRAGIADMEASRDGMRQQYRELSGQNQDLRVQCEALRAQCEAQRAMNQQQSQNIQDLRAHCEALKAWGQQKSQDVDELQETCATLDMERNLALANSLTCGVCQGVASSQGGNGQAMMPAVGGNGLGQGIASSQDLNGQAVMPVAGWNGQAMMTM